MMCLGNARRLAKFGVTVTLHPKNTNPNNTNRTKEMAIDGFPTTANRRRIYRYRCSVTDRGNNPWMQLDLKKSYLVTRVRAIVYAMSSKDVVVVVHVGSSLTNNGNDNHQCGNITYVAAAREYAVWKDVSCSPPVWGRYINFVRTVVDDYLEICETTFEYGQCTLCCHGAITI